MRPTRAVIVLAAFGIACTLLLVWLLGDDDKAAASRPNTMHDAPAAEAASAPAPAQPLESLQPAADAPPAREAVPEPAAPEIVSLDPKDCVVLGRTVDESDQPVVGAMVRLYGYKVWADGYDVPRLPGKYDLRGWDVATDASGGFRFQGPPPTADIASLTIKPDPFHDLVRVRFGNQGKDMRPKLVAGENDVGVFRLATTGAIRGRVTDESGQGIAGVQLNIGDDRSSTYGRDGETDATGAYTIASIVPGTYGVNAKSEGRLSQFKSPFEVLPQRFTDNVDFVLSPAPTISGVVIDENGAPVKDVRLWGWPKSSGQGAGATSAVDGTFTIYLPQEEPYTLEATAAGFQPYNTGNRTILHAPGTRDLHVEMKHSTQWPMHVVDASTHQPIERFGFEVLLDNSRHAPQHVWTEHSRPRMKDYAGGVAQVDFRPGVDIVVISADNYQQETIDLEPGPPPDGKIVVALKSAPSVTGRVMRDSSPAARLAVRLERGSPDQVARSGADDSMDRTFRVDRDGVHTTTTGEDGVFRFAGVESGLYRVIARTQDGFVLVVEPFNIHQREKDLGELQLEPGAVVTGEVLVPPGRSRSGLTVHLDDARSEEKQVTSSDGRFRFEALSPGVHELMLEDAPGAIADAEPLKLVLNKGETREVVFDVRDRGTCQVTLTVRFGSKPAVGSTVDLVSNSKPRSRHRLGTTDASGRVSSWAPAMGSVRVEVYTENRRTLTHPTATLDLALDTRIDETVAFDVGSLTIELPVGVVLPSAGRLSAKLRPSSGDDKVQYLGEPVVGDSAKRSWTFDTVLSGEFTLEIELTSVDAELEQVPQADGSVSYRPKAIYATKLPVIVRANETTRVSAP